MLRDKFPSYSLVVRRPSGVFNKSIIACFLPGFTLSVTSTGDFGQQPTSKIKEITELQLCLRIKIEMQYR